MNPAPFPSTPPRTIGVVEPVEHALEHVKRVLFRPFDLRKWFIIGFCAWLAQLGEGGGGGGGGGGGFNSNLGGGRSRGGGGGNFGQELEHAKSFILNNLYWIIPTLAALVIFSFVVGFIVLWLNSRGKFMFLHCVALDKAEIAEPWRMYSREANSLFVFRAGLVVAALVLLLPLVVADAVVIVKMVAAGAATAPGVLLAIALFLALIAVSIVFGIVGKLTADFVVPIMYLRHNTCLAAWRELWLLLSTHAGRFVLYFLFLIVLGIALGTLVLTVVLITCCLAGCLMAIPYLGAVVMLPVTMFKRSYSLCFLAQFGREYDVFPPPATATASNAPLGSF